MKFNGFIRNFFNIWGCIFIFICIGGIWVVWKKVVWEEMLIKKVKGRNNWIIMVLALFVYYVNVVSGSWVNCRIFFYCNELILKLLLEIILF